MPQEGPTDKTNSSFIVTFAGGSSISVVTEENPGQCLTSINITKIDIDPSYFGRIKEDPNLIKTYMETYLAGKDLPPIILEAGTLKLLEGYHRLMAVKGIIEQRQEGTLEESEIPDWIRRGFIPCEYVSVPQDVDPCLFTIVSPF